MKNFVKKIESSKYTMPFLLAMSFIPAIVQCFNTLMRGGGGLHSPYYFIGYETGFGGRKLIGSIFSLFLPEYVQHRHIVPIIFFAFLLLAALFIIFVCSTLKIKELKSTLSAQSILMFLSIYLISSYSIFSFIGQCSGFIDIYLYLLTFAFVFFYVKYRGQWYYYIGTSLIVLTGCLIHHIFCCLFFPMFFALFIYDVFADNKFNITRFFWYGTITLLLVLLFCFIWFFSSPVDIDAVYEQVCNRTNGVCIKEQKVFQWLYGTNHENYLAMWNAGEFPTRYYQFLPVVFLLSPLLSLFCAPWLMCIIKSSKGLQHTRYLLMFIAQVLLFFPIFIIATDYLRWLYAWFFSQIVMILTMYKINDTFFIHQLQEVFNWIKKHWVLSILLVIYICSISASIGGIRWIDTISSFLPQR